MNEQSYIENENYVLGCILADNEIMLSVETILRAKYFQDSKNRQLFTLFQKLFDANIPIDSVIVTEQIFKNNLDKSYVQRIAQLTDVVPSAEKAQYYSRMIVENYMRKKADKFIKELRESTEKREDPFEYIESSIENLESILAEIQDSNSEIDLSNRIDELIKRIDDERMSKSESVYKARYYPSFNNLTSGISDGNLIVISGKYKSGKTTFGTSLLMDFALFQKIPVGIFSLEMSNREFENKILSLATGTRYGYLRTPSAKTDHGNLILNDEKFADFAERTRNKLSDAKILITDNTFTFTDIKVKARNWAKINGIKMILIDYMGLIDSSRKFERRDLEIGYFSKQFKKLAKEMNIPIILLSQENDDGIVAESKALARDCDYWFSISNPWQNGNKTVKVNKIPIEIDGSLFSVKLKASRHSAANKGFYCKYHSNGEFNEIDMNYYEKG